MGHYLKIIYVLTSCCDGRSCLIFCKHWAETFRSSGNISERLQTNMKLLESSDTKPGSNVNENICHKWNENRFPTDRDIILFGGKMRITVRKSLLQEAICFWLKYLIFYVFVFAQKQRQSGWVKQMFKSIKFMTGHNVRTSWLTLGLTPPVKSIGDIFPV